MKELAKILDEKRRALGLSYQELAKRAKISSVYVSYVLRGTRIPKDGVLIKLANALELDPGWLLKLAHYEKAPDEAKPFLSESSQRFFLKDVNKFDNIQPYSLGHARPIPVLGWVQAGKFGPTVEGDFSYGVADEYIYSDIKGKNLFALRVENDSMEPVFHQGDIIVVNPNLEPKTGDYVIAKLPDRGEATFKKLIIKNKLVILRPLNQAYEDIILDPSEKFEIIGKVVERKTIF